MVGFVEKLCDIDSVDIPAELLDLQIDEQQVEHEVQLLALRYAKEQFVESVEKGDIVYCQPDADSYPDGRRIQLYTGMEIPGAAAAEMAVLGIKIGDVVETVLYDKPVTLQIQQIIRRTLADIDDALITSLQIPTVETVDAYRAYMRQKLFDNQKLELSKAIDYYLVEQMTEQSSFVMNEDELEEEVQKSIAEWTAEYARMGMELDASLDEMRSGIINQIKQSLLAQAFCQEKGIQIDEEEAKAEAEQMIEMMELMGETVEDPESYVDMAVKNAYTTKLFEYLGAVAEAKLGGSYGNS